MSESKGKEALALRGEVASENFEGLGFRQIAGSNRWPSDDLKDINYDMFVCNVCGWNFKARLYGVFGFDKETGYGLDSHEAARHTMTLHKDSRCKFITHEEEEEPSFGAVSRGHFPDKETMNAFIATLPGATPQHLAP